MAGRGRRSAARAGLHDPRRHNRRRGRACIPTRRPFSEIPTASSVPRMDGYTGSLGLEGYPPLLTADDVAKLLRVTRKAVYAMVERGQIPGVKRYGRRVRFCRDAIAAWLRGGAS